MTAETTKHESDATDANVVAVETAAIATSDRADMASALRTYAESTDRFATAVQAQADQDRRDREAEAKRTRRRYNVMFVVAGVILVAVVVLGVGLRIFTDASDKRSAQNRDLLMQVAATNRTLANYTTGPAAQASVQNEQKLIVCILDRIDKDTKGTPIPASCATFGIK